MIKKYFKYILFACTILCLNLNIQAKSLPFNNQMVAANVILANDHGGGGGRHGGGGGRHATVSQNTENKYRINICSDTNIVRVMRLIGYILIAVKILVPIGLILFGTISFAKAILANDESTLKKVTVSFAFKLIAAVVIFVLPTIINFIMSFIDGATTGTEKYEVCRVCIFDPKNCAIPK